jgi:hypothetical protein
LIPGMASDFSFSFGPMNQFPLLGKAIAESMLCGNPSIECLTVPLPPMRRHLPAESGHKNTFSIF